MRLDRIRSACVAAAVAAVGLAPACARQGAPTGGEPDRLPPVVVITRPDTFQELDVIDDPIRIVFSERISERPTEGMLDDAVIVSPRTGEVRVDHERDALEVDLSGGFRPGLVYRVTVLPVIQDMFNNPMREPFEFVFSTGGEFTATAAAGLVVDRLTGEPVEGARVVARPVAGDTTLAYVTRTDTSGIYALRYVPPGDYEILAFLDRNRDFAASPSEVQGRERVTVRDTVLTNLVVLEPDTTPARLARVVVEDSASLRLAFDDHLDPTAPAGAVAVTLEPDSTTPPDAPAPPAVSRVFHPAGWQAFRDSVAAARDTAAADTAAAAEEEPDEGGSLLDGPLPAQELFVRLGAALPTGIPYRVRVADVVNVAGLGGGGGSGLVTREAPAAPLAPDTTGAAVDTTALPADTSGAAAPFRGADTTGVPPDTSGVPPDTTGAPPDTTGVSPDTTGVPPDTTGVPPDTTGVPPDTTGVPPDTTAVPPDTTRVPPETTWRSGPVLLRRSTPSAP